MSEKNAARRGEAAAAAVSANQLDERSALGVKPGEPSVVAAVERALVATPGSGMPDYLEEAAGADAGRGVSTDAADNIVPMIYVLQPLSPEVDDTSPKRVPGAKPGMMWLRNSMLGVVSGEEGVLFQPCHFEKVWPEWVPRERGGGFVARHKNRSATAKDAARWRGVEVGEDVPDVEDADFKVDPTTRQKVWFRRSNQNDLKLTRNHAGFVVVGEGRALPYVLPLTGSGHGVSRSWMYAMMSKRLADGRIMPSWACLYRLTTRQRQNQKGKWFAFETADAGYVDAAAYRRGKELNVAFETGAVSAEAEIGGDAHGDTVGAADTHAATTTDNIPY